MNSKDQSIFLSIVNRIAGKYGGVITNYNFKTGTVEFEVPEKNRQACAAEIGKLISMDEEQIKKNRIDSMVDKIVRSFGGNTERDPKTDEFIIIVPVENHKECMKKVAERLGLYIAQGI